jgi:putative PIN family toxin of toxin-antitoxin system
MKVFLDTNVLASALVTRGACAEVLREVISRHALIVGECVLDELNRVLRRQFGASPADAQGAVALLREFHVEPTPAVLPDVPLKDTDDLKVIGAALTAWADAVVTGDKEMQSLGAVGALRILSPRAFLQLSSRG